MNRGLKIFAAVIYYVAICVLGIFLAIILPRLYSYSMPFEAIDESLANGDYDNAMRLIGGYYDKAYVYSSDKDGKKIVIFASCILESKEVDGEKIEDAKISKAYSGFLFNVKNDYDVKSEENNQTKLVCKSESDVVYNYKLINFDYENNEVNDTIMTLVDYDFIYFGITNEMLSDVDTLEFIDKDGNSFVKFENLDLDFDEAFFDDVSDFVNEYNNDYASNRLGQLDSEFRSKNDNYQMGHFEDIKKKAERKANIIVLVYFVGAFIIGDVLVGKRYLIRLIRSIVIAIKKKKNPNYETEDEKKFNDYYTQLTIVLKVPSDCDASFVITYHNEYNDIEFMLTKVDGYKVTKRVHAGVYVNPFVECEGYSSVNMPEKLEVKGFTKTYEIEFVKN